MGSYFKWILIGIVVLVLVTFGIQNRESITLHYYFQLNSMPIPIYGVVYASLVIGILIGMLVGISNRFTQHKKLKALKKENLDLKAKIGETPAPESVVEPSAEEEAPQEAAEEVKDEFEAKNEEEEEQEEEEEEEEEKETRF